MERSKIIGLAVLLVIVLIVLMARFFYYPKGVETNPLNTGVVQAPQASQNPSASIPLAIPPTSKTRDLSSQEVKVPETNATDTPLNVAIPKSVLGAYAAKVRVFDARVEGNAFTPDTFILNQGDVAHIVMRAVDRNYDFTQPDMGLFASLPKGTTRTVEFGAVLGGKFQFFCKTCGGPDKGPVGYIIIVK